jgi:hypothetical protein
LVPPSANEAPAEKKKNKGRDRERKKIGTNNGEVKVKSGLCDGEANRGIGWTVEG